MVQTKGSRYQRNMPTVHPDAAAIDVGATMHVVAVAPGRDPEPVRTFKTFTADLHRLADWLREHGVAVMTTHEPGATDVGVKVREMLLDSSGTPVTPRADGPPQAWRASRPR